MQYEVVVYDPDLFLRGQVKLRQKQAIAARRAIQARKDECLTVAQMFIDTHPKAKAAHQRLGRAARRARARAKGEALTESLDPVNIFDETPQDLSDAEMLLLKKAYRMAARIAHPDAGGTAEMFAALELAYRMRDLQAIQEFFIASQRSVLDQMKYWLDEIQRPNVAWQKFRRTAPYQITATLRRQNTAAVRAALEEHVAQVFNQRAVEMELQELHFDAQRAAEMAEEV